MTAKYDLHIHTKYLGCANQTMVVADVVRECERIGIECLAITDHLNRPDQIDLHRPILEDIRRLDTNVPVYFGVELNFTGCDEGFVWSEEIKADVGFQFAIAGIHTSYVEEYDLDKIVAIQHRHHLKVCADPLVEMLVHPYWFPRNEFTKRGMPDFESVACVPESMTRELGQAARETNTAIEINAGANIANRPDAYGEAYFEYLSILAAEGVTFATASDAHDIGELDRVTLAWDMVERFGLSDDRLWHPPGEPVVGA